jgi:hypothetical protein
LHASLPTARNQPNFEARAAVQELVLRLVLAAHGEASLSGETSLQNSAPNQSRIALPNTSNVKNDLPKRRSVSSTYRFAQHSELLPRLWGAHLRRRTAFRHTVLCTGPRIFARAVLHISK